MKFSSKYLEIFSWFFDYIFIFDFFICDDSYWLLKLSDIYRAVNMWMLETI